MMNSSDKLPHDGELLVSPSRKFKETVIFVHHFGGHKRSTKRHQEILLQAGYNCVTFNLYYNSFAGKMTLRKRLKNMLDHFISRRKSFICQWTNELSNILDQVPGDKIIFSLSSPSVSVASSMASGQRKDIKAWICDCGPFLDVWTCFWNYNKYEAKIKNPLLLILFNTLGFLMFGGKGYKKHVEEWLLSFPKDFPVLSLRSGKDRLVPPSSIDKFFNIYNNLMVKSHCFDEAGHLTAIKSHTSKYSQIILTFLQKNSSSLESSAD